MSTNIYPNTFQVHNFYVDNLLHLLDGDEIKVLLYTIRRIIGFNKAQHQDKISLSQYETGIKKYNGEALDHGTGLGRKRIIDCLRELKLYGIIEESPPSKITATKCYKLQMEVDKINFVGLNQRLAQQKAINRNRTQQATQTKQNKNLYPSTSSFHEPDCSSSHVPVASVHHEPSTSSSSEPINSSSHEHTKLRRETQIETQIKNKNMHVSLSLDARSSLKQKSFLDEVEQEIEAAEKEKKPVKVKPPYVDPSPMVEVFHYWKEIFGKRASVKLERGDPYWKCIEARLREGFTAEDLKAAIKGCSLSPWHMGLNDDGTSRGKKDNSITLICRDKVKVDYFISLYENHNSTENPSTELLAKLPQPKGRKNWANETMDSIDRVTEELGKQLLAEYKEKGLLTE